MKEPNIRFNGFRGEWKTSIIGDIATFSKGRGYSKSDLRSEGNPIVLYGRLYTNYSSVIESVDTFASLQNGSVLTKGNEVIIPGSGETPEDIAVASTVQQKGAILGGDLNVLTFDQEKLSPAFAAMSITYSNTHNELSAYAQGKTVVHLHNSSISKGHISYPYIDEQQSISTYFQHLDALIQSTTKKIESLKQVKAASLLSMFPQEGETTPRVRFKEFEGEWEKVQFSELYEPSSIKNKTFGADKIISVANMYFKPVSYVSDEEYLKSYNVMNLGDIAFEGNKSKDYAHGRFVENTIGDGIVSHVFIVLKPISKQYDLQFWKYLINYERIMGPILLRSTKHSTMMTDLVVSDFLKESVLVPSYEEQIEIGKILSSLDRQITLHTQRLEKLKQIKTACLDEMFV